MNVPIILSPCIFVLTSEPFLMPEFWRNTFLARHYLGNPAWNWILAVVILLLAFMVRSLVHRFMPVIAKRFSERGKAQVAGLVKDLRPAARLFIMTIGLTLILQSGLLVFSERVTLVNGKVMDTLKAVIVCLILLGVGTGLIEYMTEKAKEEGRKQVVTVHAFYRKAVQVAAVILGVFMALKIWGFDISGLIAGIGIGGLALSLAAQDTFSNLLAGLAIMTDHSFAIGDVITSPDVEGIVEDMSFRSSKIRTFSQALVTVPNSKLSNSAVTNLSKIGKRRIRFSIGLEYGVTPEQIRSLIEKLRTRMAARETVYEDNIVIFLEKFSASSIDVLFQCFVNIVDFIEYLKEQESILLEIMDIMDEENLDFAFSALTVHLNDLSRQREALENNSKGKLDEPAK
jgi:MscS family membrane protein